MSLAKCSVLSKNGFFYAAYLERIMFSSEACDDFAIYYSFKVKCAKNLYWDVSFGMLLTLKVFCMAKLAVNFDVNIALSNYGFNGVAAFANI